MANGLSRSAASIEVQEYLTANWFTRDGVAAKRRQIESKGIPSMKDWRFMTLTLDPHLFADEVDGYLCGKDRLRRFLSLVRAELGEVDQDPARWCWKMEFSESGWVHWHLPFEYTKKLSPDQLEFLTEAWGLGRVNVKRMSEDGLEYLFKYVTKEPGSFPEWFLDYHAKSEGQRAKTFYRARFWQTSKGFYTGEPPQTRPPAEKKTSLLPMTVRQAKERYFSTCRIVARWRCGTYRKSKVVLLEKRWSQQKARLTLAKFIGWCVPLEGKTYEVRAHLLELHKSCQQTLKHLLSLHQRRNLLEACPF